MKWSFIANGEVHESPSTQALTKRWYTTFGHYGMPTSCLCLLINQTDHWAVARTDHPATVMSTVEEAMLLQFARDKMGVEVGYLNIYTAGVDIIKWMVLRLR